MLTHKWQKPTRCDNSGPNCVEVKQEDDGTVSMRSTTVPGTVVYYTPTEWSAFIDSAKAGQYDLPA